MNPHRSKPRIPSGLLLLGTLCQAAIGQETGVNNNPEPRSRLPEVVVEGRADSLVGLAGSASEGTIGVAQLGVRPTLRTGELLEAIPGVIITQHAGGGKANQYFLRGFNLDHGTDFSTTLDGMPLNQPTHGHGQGYTDLNGVIPELVYRVRYTKGVYAAENGDFSSAGAAHMETYKVLPENLATVEGGMYGYARALVAASPKASQGHVLYAFEALHHDGPWANPDDFQKFNGTLAYNTGDDSLGWGVTARAYRGRWDSSDQVAASAVADGLIGFFNSLDDTTGGDSQRYSLQAEWHRSSDESATKVNAYGVYYDLDLFSNFTYFLVDPVLGDQFEQKDRRGVGGFNASHTLFHQLHQREVETTFGIQFRNDVIRNGLYNTQGRQRTSKTNAADGSSLPDTTREDDILQTSGGLYLENKIQWAEKLRTVAGIRGDLHRVVVESQRRENSDDRAAAIASPKLSTIFGPWASTELYVQGGLGFHSNDGRGATTRIDPTTGSPADPADLLVQTYGAEAGIRTTHIKGLHSTVSVWWLDIDSELLFVGDAGSTEASRPSRRFGVEWANFYHITPRLTLDADASLSHAEFRDDDPAGNQIPGSIETVIAAGLTYRAETGFFAGTRLRYFGPRPLIEDNSIRSGDTILLGFHAGYRFNKTWTVKAEVFNALDRRDHDIDYTYESRVRPGDPATTQVHYHPVEPIQARIGLTARF